MWNKKKTEVSKNELDSLRKTNRELLSVLEEQKRFRDQLWDSYKRIEQENKVLKNRMGRNSTDREVSDSYRDQAFFELEVHCQQLEAERNRLHEANIQLFKIAHGNNDSFRRYLENREEKKQIYGEELIEESDAPADSGNPDVSWQEYARVKREWMLENQKNEDLQKRMDEVVKAGTVAVDFLEDLSKMNDLSLQMLISMQDLLKDEDADYEKTRKEVREILSSVLGQFEQVMSEMDQKNPGSIDNAQVRDALSLFEQVRQENRQSEQEESVQETFIQEEPKEMVDEEWPEDELPEPAFESDEPYFGEEDDFDPFDAELDPDEGPFTMDSEFPEASDGLNIREEPPVLEGEFVKKVSESKKQDSDGKDLEQKEKDTKQDALEKEDASEEKSDEKPKLAETFWKVGMDFSVRIPKNAKKVERKKKEEVYDLTGQEYREEDSSYTISKSKEYTGDFDQKVVVLSGRKQEKNALMHKMFEINDRSEYIAGKESVVSDLIEELQFSENRLRFDEELQDCVQVIAPKKEEETKAETRQTALFEGKEEKPKKKRAGTKKGSGSSKGRKPKAQVTAVQGTLDDQEE